MKTLGDILIEEGIISEKDLEDSLKVQKKNNLPLSHIIQKKGIAGEADILRALSKLYQLEFREKLEFTGMEEIFLQIPLKLIQKSRIVPFSLSKKTIRIAVSDPSDLHPMDDARNFLKGYNVEFILAPEPE
ncbi:type II secretion system protein GspE, partial [Leptospira interrogans]